MPLAKNLTIKQRKFIKELISCHNPTEAAFRVYDCKDRNSAKVIACENLTKLNFSMVDLMEKMGLSDEEDMNDLKRLRKAQRLQSCDIYVKKITKDVEGYKEETGKYTINKNSNDFVEVDDNHIQLKALELTYKLKGKLKEKDINIDQSKHITYIVDYSKVRDIANTSSGKRV